MTQSQKFHTDDRASDILRKKSKILWDFQGQIRGKISGFSWEKNQNSQKNRPISRDISGKKSNFEGFSGANS